ncbi:hypothetical protein VU04_03140 [Desulfobulbus sp. TB]|nr:hypothetical protein [Desulfobulbus sp. TB]
MKFTLRTMTLFLTGVVLLISWWQTPSFVYAGACGEGTGMPPFLSGGAEPNLLMLLDNSGSMLDPAYVKETQDTYGSYCFDDSYNSNTTYSGYFEKDKWYVWEEGGDAWNASGKDITADPWVASWKDQTTYSAGEIVYANGGLYKAMTSGTSNDTTPEDGFNIDHDGNITWSKVSQAPVVNSLTTTCTDNSLVAYNNSVYVCKSDTWHRLEGGQFVQKDDATKATSVCTSAAGDKFSLTGELCITIFTTIVNSTTIPSSVNAFAARGNLLNWVTASKFDIQKKILTGGKYDPDNNQLVSENRGCAGYGYVKQISLPDGAIAKTLTMRARGANGDDRVGNTVGGANTDDTTRIEIVGLTDGGFEFNADCKTVFADILSGSSLNQRKIDGCMGGKNYDGGNAQSTFSHTVNACNDVLRNNGVLPANKLSTVVKSCEDSMYANGYNPRYDAPEDGGYVCWGIYDPNVSADKRIGYLGRCWDNGDAAECGNGTCESGENNNNCSQDCSVQCGNNACESGENNNNCSQDCSAQCGNDACESGENNNNCSQDCSAECGNNVCETGESNSTCPSDCNVACGNGTCESGENNNNCSQDCDPVCNNGVCESGENNNNCSQDCSSVCPNDICESDESSLTCIADCPSVCPNGICEPDETSLSCIADCPSVCPNGVCEPDETSLSCSADCLSACNPKTGTSDCTPGAAAGANCWYCGPGGTKKGNCADADQDIYLNERQADGSIWNLKCKGSSGTNGNGYTCTDGWEVQYVDGDGNTCIPSASIFDFSAPGYYYGMDRLIALAVIGVQPGSGASGAWDNSGNPECTYQAMTDFCNSWTTPEVIDPSDQLGSTEQTWNLPAMLIDGGVVTQLGLDNPIAVMKGLIQYEQPEEQKNDAVTEPNGPRGIIYDVATDLRLGVMAFTENGAKTECDILFEKCADNNFNGQPDICDTSANSDDCTYCKNRQAITPYCPENNSDGAKVIQPVKLGVTGDETTGLDWTHYKNIVTSINETRATAWTPLAEAMHTALGYYTQNVKFCLNPQGTTTEADCESFPISDADDPVDYWCQDNNILIITEGASTADVSQDVVDFVSTPSQSFATGQPENGDITTGDTDGALDLKCADGLDGSSYFDDMAWWGKHVLPLYKERKLLVAGSNNLKKDKQDVETYIVTTGSLRNDGTDECSPAVLMRQAALNGSNDLRNEYAGEDPAKLESNLRAVFSDILSRSSAGSAASVISSSRSGSGAVYQAIFWPQYKDSKDNQVSWVGDVHALFMSSGGFMYEDTDQNGKLEPSEDLNNNGGIKTAGTDDLDAYSKSEDANGNGQLDGKDKRVFFYFSEKVNRTRGCYNITGFIQSGGKCLGDAAAMGDEDRVDEDKCQPGDHCVEIGDIAYLWSASEKLRDRGIGTRSKRKLLTWNDADNDGKVDDGEFFNLNDTSGATWSWSGLNAIADQATTDGRPRGKVTYDFLTPDDWNSFIVDDGGTNVEETALTALVEWLDGKEQYYDDGDEGVDKNVNGRFDRKLRSRMYDFAGDGIDPLGTDVWRLGDVIHSTPLVVSKPAEIYQYIYRDASYADFYKKWSQRRNVVYFGANDGMLHAVNGGFYVENTGQFCCAIDANGNCEAASAGSCTTGPDLGDEIWAYIPYNLQPHLKCLALEGYEHKYYIDQKPRIFDVQIFEEEAECSADILSEKCIHAGGWGTILVGGMGFGGAPIDAETLDVKNENTVDDNREFISSFFILDITNPEANPVLLGELTKTGEKDSQGNEIYADLNYTTSVPTLVVMRDDDGGEHTDWYLVMGSGPTNLDGTNQEQGKLAVMPLEWLQGSFNPSSWVDGIPPVNSIDTSTRRAFRIPNTAPAVATNQGGVFLVPSDSSGGQKSFISDLVTIDFDIESSAKGTSGVLYRSDAVYFGTTDGTGFSYYPQVVGEDPKTYWNGGGRIFRLVTRTSDVDSDKKVVEKASKPSDWTGQWTDNQPLRLLLDVKAPVTSALSVGYDSNDYWIYGGTGRFFDKKDKTDDGMYNADTSITPAENGKVSFFGIKEPMAKTKGDLDFSGVGNADVVCSDGIMTWDTVDWDVNSKTNADLASSNAPGKRGLMQVDNIIVSAWDADYQASLLACSHCLDSEDRYDPTCAAANGCFPSDLPLVTLTDKNGDKIEDVATFANLQKYIAGEGCSNTDATGVATGLDGWYKEFHEQRERNLGQAALLGGLLTFTSYQPFEDKCNAEGVSNLYGVHYQTGTAWTESVFGVFTDEYTKSDGTKENREFVLDKLSLGQGLATTPSMHVGTGDQAASAFIQTSTGEIIEVKQENLPLGNTKSGRTGWTDQCTP